MKLLFREFVAYLEAELPVPQGVDPTMWANASYQKFWLAQNPQYLQQVQQQSQQPQQTTVNPVIRPSNMQGANPQYLQQGQQPGNYQRSGFAPRAAARVLTPTNPVQGQTGAGLEAIPAGGRVPDHLVSQIPQGDIAPAWNVATKFYYGKDRKVYRK